MVLLSVTAFAALTAPTQEVLSQLSSIRAIDISPTWAPDILAGRERVEKMLKAYLALPKADKASISAADTTLINQYLDGFCSAIKTDKAAYVKKHGSAGTTMPSSSSSSSSSKASTASSSSEPASGAASSVASSAASSVASSAASVEDEVTSTDEALPQEEQSVSDAASKPAITLAPSDAEVNDAESTKPTIKKKKSALDIPVKDIVKIMIITFVTVLLTIMLAITAHYIKHNRKIARQREEMLLAAHVYSHVYRIKAIRRGKLLKKKEYAAVGAASAEVRAKVNALGAEPKAFVEHSAPPPPPKLAVEAAANTAIKKPSQHKKGKKSSKKSSKNRAKK